MKYPKLLEITFSFLFACLFLATGCTDKLATKQVATVQQLKPHPLNPLDTNEIKVARQILLDEGKPHVPIASLSPEASRRSVTLLSPNKAFGFPGAGCAFAVIEDPGLRRAFSSDHHATVHDASVFGYEAALAAYRDCDDWLRAQLAYLRANRDLVEREIAATPNLKMAHVEATYLAWIDASGLGVADPHKHFLDRGVALSPGTQFGAPQYVRLNFGTQKARLAEALKRISSASRPSPRG